MKEYKHKDMKMLSYAQEYYRIKTKVMHKCNNCGARVLPDVYGKYASRCDKCLELEAKRQLEKRNAEGTKVHTLCWSCIHSVPRLVDGVYVHGCEWSLRFEPVEGWDAEPHSTKLSKEKTITSYHVKKCPKYVKESRKRRPLFLMGEDE